MPNAAPADDAIAAVEEGVHAMHGEFRYKCEVVLGQMLFALSVHNVT